MRNEFTNLKMYLQFLNPMDQISHIDMCINKPTKYNRRGTSPNKKFNRIQQLKKLKHDLLLNL